MRRISITVAAVACALALTPAPDANSQGTVLLFHGGSFLMGSPSWEDEHAAWWRSQGWATEQVDYPLGNVPAASRLACQRARALRRAGQGPVITAGSSAGGTLALFAAARRCSNAGVSIRSPLDLVAWFSTGAGAGQAALANVGTLDRQVRYSPSYRWVDERYVAPDGSVVRPSRPAFVVGSRGDSTVPWWQAEQMAGRPRVEVFEVSGEHAGGDDVSWRGPALDWLDRIGLR